jgi:hypothetical protein
VFHKENRREKGREEISLHFYYYFCDTLIKVSKNSFLYVSQKRILQERSKEPKKSFSLSGIRRRKGREERKEKKRREGK